MAVTPLLIVTKRKQIDALRELRMAYPKTTGQRREELKSIGKALKK